MSKDITPTNVKVQMSKPTKDHVAALREYRRRRTEIKHTFNIFDTAADRLEATERRIKELEGHLDFEKESYEEILRHKRIFAKRAKERYTRIKELEKQQWEYERNASAIIDGLQATIQQVREFAATLGNEHTPIALLRVLDKALIEDKDG